MYDLQLDIATHVTNGLAVKYPTLGFKNADAAPVAYVDSFDGFLDGYYIDMFKGTTHVEYQDNGAIADKAAFVAKYTGDGANGLYVIGDTDGYDLVVKNKSGTTVDVTATYTFTNFENCPGIKAIYLMYAVDGGEAQFLKVTTGSAITLIDDMADSDTAKTVNIKAYVALSDYYSADLPNFVDPSVTVAFNAATA